MTLRERLIAKQMQVVLAGATILELRDALGDLSPQHRERLLELVRNGMNAEVGNVIRAALESFLLPTVLDTVDSKLLSNRFTVEEVQELIDDQANVRLSPRPGNGRGTPPPRP